MRGVLVAEDNAALRGLYRLWLEGEGYVVSEAADGREAIRLLETGPLPDAVATVRIVIVRGIQPVAPEANAIIAQPCDREELLTALLSAWTRDRAAGRARARRRAGVPLERR